jgi:hypothetical protein
MEINTMDKVREFEIISEDDKKYTVYEYKKRIYPNNLSSKTKTYVHAKLATLKYEINSYLVYSEIYQILQVMG